MKYSIYVLSIAIFVAAAICVQTRNRGDATPRGTAYRVFDLHGGQWQDAEKHYSDGGFTNGHMCWGAVASNMLTWGGWNEGTGLANIDEVWEYYQKHWISAAGDPVHAIKWWFRGGNRGYPIRKAPGGGFFPNLDPRDYISGPYEGTELVLEQIQKNTIEGYVSSIRMIHPKERVPHTVTCWGFNANDKTGDIIGIWITDSDDDANGAPPRPSRLRYFEVKTRDGVTYIQRYARGKGTKAYFIDEVLGLAANPARKQPAHTNTASGQQ